MTVQRPHNRVTIRDCLGTTSSEDALLSDVIEGLSQKPYSLPPKWFYDARGSELFEQITRLTEYYPTEAERSALNDHAVEISVLSGADTLVELGSGISDKTRVLLDAMDSEGQLERYIPFDVSIDALETAANMIADRYQQISVDAVAGDFDHHIGEIPNGGKRMFAFLGGTIGNYDHKGRIALLSAIAESMDPGESLLLGTDLVKSTDRLISAYDDKAGVTAAFNLNVLNVINRGLGADFETSHFDHRAVWNQTDACIEMRLRSNLDHTVKIPQALLAVEFEKGDEILTEISSKFTRERITAELETAGLQLNGWFSDPAEDFALSLSTKPPFGEEITERLANEI